VSWSLIAGVIALIVGGVIAGIIGWCVSKLG
jgi:hypothetical protein